VDNDITQEQIDRISDALASGRKIEAIKIYREATGQGLKEAKDFIEALIPKLKEQDPEKYASLGQGSGCSSAAVLCIGLVAVAVFWIATRIV